MGRKRDEDSRCGGGSDVGEGWGGGPKRGEGLGKEKIRVPDKEDAGE